jgi:hypothetical protein
MYVLIHLYVHLYVYTYIYMSLPPSLKVPNVSTTLQYPWVQEARGWRHIITVDLINHANVTPQNTNRYCLD